MLSIRIFTGILLLASILFFMHNSYSTNNTLFLFSHGIADSHRQAYHYCFCYPRDDSESMVYIDQEILSQNQDHAYNDRFIITTPFVTFDYPDSTDRFYRINIRRSGLAQTVDINHLAWVFNKTYKKYQRDIVLMGVSRGASTIITFVGQERPDHVSALILESPFDAMETVIAHKIKQARLHKIPGLQQLSHAIVSSVFFKYHMNGIRPIDLITQIDKNIPILLICSLEDTLVPPVSTIRLYQTLYNDNRSNVHLAVIPRGKHARIISSPDGDIYQNISHAFLKAYNLPHDKHRAEEGKPFFKKTQPNIQELAAL